MEGFAPHYNWTEGLLNNLRINSSYLEGTPRTPHPLVLAALHYFYSAGSLKNWSRYDHQGALLRTSHLLAKNLRAIFEAAAEGDKSIWSPYFGEFFRSLRRKNNLGRSPRGARGCNPSKQLAPELRYTFDTAVFS